MINEAERLPILRLWRRLLVTVQGEITDALAEQLSEDLLELIHVEGADGLVLDLTGVWTMDSHLCAALSRLARSASLMGTRTIISGLSPEIAQTLQMMGIELDVQTALTVELAFEKLGVSVQLERPTSPLEAQQRNPFARRNPWGDGATAQQEQPGTAFREVE